MKNYYRILGLNEKSTKEDIVYVGRYLLNKYQVENIFANKVLGKDYTEEELNEANHRYEQLAEAYQTLTDEHKRSVYDAQLRKYKRQRNASKNKSSFGRMIDSFKEVRTEEKQNPLYKRHQELNQAIKSELHNNVSSVPGEIVYQIINGTLHVSCEFIHQLRKLGYICEDSMPKYVFRNRNLVAAALAVTLITSSMGANVKNTNEVPEVTTNITQEVTTEETVPQNRIHIVYEDSIMPLIGYYQVEKGDTLTSISNKTGVNVKDIQSENNLLDDKIYSGEILKIPYSVDIQDLSYYTQTVNAKGITCAELAKMYHTDVTTIKLLNREALANVNGNFTIISDTAVVPAFVSAEEFQSLKEQAETQKTLK